MLDLGTIEGIYTSLLDYVKKTRELYENNRIDTYRGEKISKETYELIKNVVLGELDGFEMLIKRRLSQLAFIEKYEKEGL